LVDQSVWRQLLEPHLVVVVQAAFVVVYENAGMMFMAFTRVILIPLTAEAIAAIVNVLSKHNCSQLVRLNTNPAAALLADIGLVKRAGSKAHGIHHLE
jgi:hypothetical protein